jgi:hypothetical protein
MLPFTPWVRGSSAPPAAEGSYIYDNNFADGGGLDFAENGVDIFANNATPNTITVSGGQLHMVYVWLNPTDFPASIGTGQRTGRMCETRINLGAKYPDARFLMDFVLPENYYHPRNDDPDGYTYGDDGAYNNKLFLLFEDDYEDGPFLQSVELHPHDTEMGASKGALRTFSTQSPAIDENQGYGQMPNFLMLSDRGKRIRLYFRFLYATVANNDGGVQIWKQVDDDEPVLIFEKMDFAWYRGPSALGFDYGYFLGAANSAFAATSAADNVDFAFNRIVFDDTALPGLIE